MSASPARPGGPDVSSLPAGPPPLVSARAQPALAFYRHGRYFPADMLSRSPFPSGFIQPCLPTLAHAVPDGSRWAFELKHDGYRFIARRDGDRVRVFYRSSMAHDDVGPDHQAEPTLSIGHARRGRCPLVSTPASWRRVV